MPKLLEGTDLTKLARLVVLVVLAAVLLCGGVPVVLVEEEDGGDGEGRWNPILMAALRIRSLRQVRCGSSAFGAVGVAWLMMVEVEEPVRAEDLERVDSVLLEEEDHWCW